MYDTIIVGAGTAGLTAAIYLRRASKKVLVFEAKSYGGQIINASIIDNYPAEPHISGFDFATKLYNQAKELGSEIRFEKVVNIEDGDIKKVITEKDTYECKTIILATGSDNRKLGLEDEDKLIGKGISYCATCDGNFYKNKVVAVAGGGNSAIEDALYLSNLASKVYVIHRRDEFRAEDKLLNELKEKNNVEFILNSNVTKLNSNDLLESIELTDKDGNKKVINLDGLFIAVGRIPENENFASIVNLNENGYVIATEDCNTNAPGIFVAGDNRTKTVRQLVTAASDGAVAASESIKYINKNKL